MDVIQTTRGDIGICSEILGDLPEWFGIDEAKENYIRNASGLPMLVFNRDHQPIGFMSIKRQTTSAAELYVLGVKRRFQRQGVGRALLRALVDYARGEDMSFLTVKTLAATSADPHYAATRKFYERVGFLPIEVFPTLWGAANPCLLMILPLR